MLNTVTVETESGYEENIRNQNLRPWFSSP